LTDLFGFAAAPAPFQDIRDQRPSAADEKAQLCMHLNTLLKRTPPPDFIATVQSARAFAHAHKQALKKLNARTTSRPELSEALNSLAQFFPEAE
jgi:hypothetical protein